MTRIKNKYTFQFFCDSRSTIEKVRNFENHQFVAMRKSSKRKKCWGKSAWSITKIWKCEFLSLLKKRSCKKSKWKSANQVKFLLFEKKHEKQAGVRKFWKKQTHKNWTDENQNWKDKNWKMSVWPFWKSYGRSWRCAIVKN